MGGLEDSATGILSEVSKPLSWSMPALKICERLKKMDAQVCDIKFGKLENFYFYIYKWKKAIKLHINIQLICFKYKLYFILDKEIDWKTVNLKKMKVKDLKKILDNWGEICDGCLEKTDYIKRVEELKPSYVKEEL